MAIIEIKDLESSEEMDRAAMREIIGGRSLTRTGFPILQSPSLQQKPFFDNFTMPTFGAGNKGIGGF